MPEIQRHRQFVNEQKLFISSLNLESTVFRYLQFYTLKMSIRSTFESSNSPLNELVNSIKFVHPNIKSMKVRFLNPESKQVATCGLTTSHLEREHFYFVIEREIVLPVSAILVKRVLGSDHTVVKLLTYVKVTASKIPIPIKISPNEIVMGSRVENIDMITSVPACFHAYAKGHEIVNIKSLEGPGCVVSLALNYLLTSPEEEGLLKSFGFSVNSVVRKFIETIRNTLITQYSSKRQLQFGESCSHNIISLEQLRMFLSQYV